MAGSPARVDAGGDPLLAALTARWQEDGVGTNAGVTVTHAADAAALHFATGVQGSGDAAALVTIEAPAATILWRKRFSGAFVFSEVFPPGVIRGGANEAILVKISASTANCEANIQGMTAAAVS